MDGLKKFILDLISFNTPKARVVSLSAIISFFILLPTKYVECLPAKCVFKHFILPLIFNDKCPVNGLLANCECPACGMTRAMSRLLHGDTSGAYAYNRMVLLVLFVMLTVIAYNVYLVLRKK